MDFNDTPEEAEYRARARAWLADHAPAHEVHGAEALDDAEQVRRGRAWQRALYDGGFAGIALPRKLGGQGGTALQAVIFAEEEARYALPKGPYIGIGLGMALPVIGRHGNDEQRARFLEATLKGDITWCQLFSEPSAGSDLANLRTKAVRQGDGYVVNGQKVWSSWAHLTDWGILVTRTDPSVPKHKGLTFFVVDMRSPGIEVRPIRQISGASDFNETFLTDVVIPETDRIGAEGEGWACCMTVLMGERMGTGAARNGLEQLIALARQTPTGASASGRGNALDDGGARLALATALAEERGGKYLGARLRTMMSRNEDPGAMAGMIKLSYASRQQRALGLAMELRGYGAIAARDEDAAVKALQYDYIWSAVMRIAGGADEVLRNQIAERVLGMPSEIRADKNVPFDQL